MYVNIYVCMEIYIHMYVYVHVYTYSLTHPVIERELPENQEFRRVYICTYV